MWAGNFTFGPEGAAESIHTIDFGFAAALPRTDLDHPASFCGTPEYASENAMTGAQPHGARDDVESLVYTLLDFHLRGETCDQQLPCGLMLAWMGPSRATTIYNPAAEGGSAAAGLRPGTCCASRRRCIMTAVLPHPARMESL